MAYAIIKIQGKQYRVSEGETLLVDRLSAKEGDTLNISDVLLYADNDKIEIGTPTISGKTVTAKVVALTRGEKIRVATYKAKSRYRRTIGHRQDLTELSIVSLSGKSAAKQEASAKLQKTTSKIAKPAAKKAPAKTKPSTKKPTAKASK